MNLLQLPLIRRSLTAIATTMVVAGLAAVAAAEEDASGEQTYSNQFYVGIGAGISRVHPDSDTGFITVGEPLSTGYSLAVGYDFSRWLSLEVYGADLGEAAIDFMGQEVGDVAYQVFGASLLGTFYRSGGKLGFDSSKGSRKGLSLYGRVGIGTINTQTDLDYRRDNPQHVAFGIGMEYGMRNGFSVRGELMSYDTDAQLLQVALVKRFGGTADQRTRSPNIKPKPVADPKPAPPKPAPAPPAVLPNTYFAFDKHNLTAEARQTVTTIANLLGDIEGLIVVEGHADTTGPVNYNQALSERRANSVRDALVAQGIDANRLLVKGYGEKRPAAFNDTAEGRAKNRRVEVTLRAQ